MPQAFGIFCTWSGIEPGPPAVKVWSPNHGTTREFPRQDRFWRTVMIQCVYTFYYTLPFLPFIYLGKEKSFLTQCVGVSCILSCTTREVPLFCFRNNYFKYRDGRVFLSSFLFLKQFILYPRCHISTPPPPPGKPLSYSFYSDITFHSFTTYVCIQHNI